MDPNTSMPSPRPEVPPVPPVIEVNPADQPAISPTPPVSPVPPVPTAPTKIGSKSFLIIVTILIIVLLGAVGVLAYQRFMVRPVATPSPSPTATVDPTAGWKTYTNTKYAYSIKYPLDWRALTISPTDPNSLIDAGKDSDSINIWPVTASNEQIGSTSVSIGVMMPDGGTIDNLFKNYQKAASSLGNTPVTKHQKTENGKQFVAYVFSLGNGKYLELSTSYDVNSPIKITIDQILSTFKFLGQDETANWKTYTNQALGFSFKYPSEYTLEEKGNKDYINLITNPTDPFKGQIGIDLQSITNNISYNTILASEEAKLTNIKTQTDGNWLKITGNGTGYSEGEKFTIAISKLQNGAIKLSTISTNTSVLNVFGQILSTFKFTR